MTKIRFDNLSHFSFKLIPKKKVIKNYNSKKITKKLINGICIAEEDKFKIEVCIKTLKPDILDNTYPDILLLDFTEESYNVKDVLSVFDRTPDKNGKYVRYIRNNLRAKFFPGNSEKYIPFCPNWICNGYIVKRNGKLMFDFNECLFPKSYYVEK